MPELVNKEGKELVKKGFAGRSGADTLETANGSIIRCTEDTKTGQVSGTKKVVKVIIVCKGAEALGLGKCNSPGQPAGTIVTKELEGEIGYINAAEKTVGVEFWPSGRTAAEKEKHEFKALLAEWECTGFATDKMRGSLVCQLTPVNKLIGQLTMTCSKGANKGEMRLKKLQGVEGGVETMPECSLNGGAFERCAWEFVETLTFEEEVELRA